MVDVELIVGALTVLGTFSLIRYKLWLYENGRLRLREKKELLRDATFLFFISLTINVAYIALIVYNYYTSRVERLKIDRIVLTLLHLLILTMLIFSPYERMAMKSPYYRLLILLHLLALVLTLNRLPDRTTGRMSDDHLVVILRDRQTTE